jgi:hypothetical protein
VMWGLKDKFNGDVSSAMRTRSEARSLQTCWQKVVKVEVKEV